MRKVVKLKPQHAQNKNIETMKQSLPSPTWNQTKIKGTQSAHKIKQKIKKHEMQPKKTMKT